MWNEPSKTRLTKIPKFHETENISLKDKLIHLHFFIGGCNWYVAEYDDKTDTFFGYVILNGDTQNAEWGYFDFNELKQIQIHGKYEVECESDKYWVVKKASEIDKINC